MRLQQHAICLFAILLCCVAWAQEIGIEAPEQVEPNTLLQFPVTGLAPEDLPRATVDWKPREGVVVIPTQDWGGRPLLVFLANREGSVSITISLNRWIETLELAVDAARNSGAPDTAIQALEQITSGLHAEFAYKHGAATIEVRSPLPSPVLSISLPKSIREGETVQGTISNSAYSVPLEASLTASTNSIQVPALVTTPPGTFAVAAPDNSAEDGDVVATVKATARGVVTTAQITVIDDDSGPPPGPRTVVIVTESENDTVQRELALYAVRLYCQQNGHTLYLLDPDQEGEIAEKYLPMADGVASLVVVAGDQYQSVRLPATADQIISQIKEWGG